MTDTTREAVESLICLIDHNKAWEGLQEVDVETYQQAADTLRALLAAKEAAEAEWDALVRNKMHEAANKASEKCKRRGQFDLAQDVRDTILSTLKLSKDKNNGKS